MAGEVVNSNFGPLNKFGASRQEIASKTATSHMREPLYPSLKIKQIYYALNFCKKNKRISNKLLYWSDANIYNK